MIFSPSRYIFLFFLGHFDSPAETARSLVIWLTVNSSKLFSLSLSLCCFSFFCLPPSLILFFILVYLLWHFFFFFFIFRFFSASFTIFLLFFALLDSTKNLGFEQFSAEMKYWKVDWTLWTPQIWKLLVERSKEWERKVREWKSQFGLVSFMRDLCARHKHFFLSLSRSLDDYIAAAVVATSLQFPSLSLFRLLCLKKWNEKEKNKWSRRV